jgi:hypothetical protein
MNQMPFCQPDHPASLPIADSTLDSCVRPCCAGGSHHLCRSFRPRRPGLLRTAKAWTVSEQAGQLSAVGPDCLGVLVER